MKQTDLASVLSSFRTELEMIRDFAKETDAILLAKRPKLPDTPFNSAEKEELKQLRDTLDASLPRKNTEDKFPFSINLTFSERVADYVLQTISPIKQRGFLSEMALAYLISYLEAFVKDYVFRILIANPRMLRSNATIMVKDAIAHQSMKALKHALAEQEVERLGYGSIDDVAIYFEQKLNISLSAFYQWDELREHVYRRNLVVHNKGRVNDTYRRKVGYTGKVGHINTNMAYVEDAASRIIEFVDFVHTETVKKLKPD